jgi:PAS domain S-box-containing protein
MFVSLSFLAYLSYFLAAALLSGAFLLLFYNNLCVRREREMNANNISQNARLALVLQTGRLHLWIYEPALRHYFFLSNSGDYTEDFNPVEFSRLYDRDDFEVLRSKVFDIADGKLSTAVVEMRGSLQNDGTQRRYEVTVSLSSRSADGRVERVLGVQRDVTENYEKKRQIDRLLIRYHNVFNSSQMDMVYYDKDGIMRDINEKACEEFGVTDRRKLLEKQPLLNENPLFNFIDVNHLVNTRATSMVDFDREENSITDGNVSGMMYYESTINPIRNAEGKLEGVYMAGRNVTEMVRSYHMLQEGAEQLRKATERIRDYVNDINFALRISNIRFVNYYPDKFTLEIAEDVNRTRIRLSQLRAIRLGTLRFRRTISSILNRMDHLSPYPINETIETEIRDEKGRQMWLLINMVPMVDAEGKVERYFGMMRNITELVETERRLAVETRKAQETELLKQSFLTNMSYEIRTPLNTVIGFAELFETEHDVADEPVFVEEIKRNSNRLLTLVNDVLFLSRLDAKMNEYTLAVVDFAQVFDGFCLAGWSGVSPQVRTVVDNPYQRLLVTIDAANVGLVIQRLCMMTVAYTQEGSIRASYEYRHGELAIVIEDTSPGVVLQSPDQAFERFVRDVNGRMLGTGLDLPIVKSLVEQMGGSVELQSEQGKGSTVWVSIPCQAQVIEKRRDVVV